MATPALEHDEHYAYDDRYQLYKVEKYNYTLQRWEFSRWMPHGWTPQQPQQQQQQQQPHPQLHTRNDSVTSNPIDPRYARGRGPDLVGTYNHLNPNTLHYEPMDPSYYVRPSTFFVEGRVFAVIMNETAGETARDPTLGYNPTPSITTVRYQGNRVHTQTRRFVVVCQKREFCFACPIFTYKGQATLKRGVRADEHGIIYSMGSTPALVQGEHGITKTSIGVDMLPGERPLQVASRCYYGIHHPIQYNVRVKDIGMVRATHIPALRGNWAEEANKMNPQPLEDDDDDEDEDEDEYEYEYDDGNGGGRA